MYGTKRQPLNNEQLLRVLLALYRLYYHNEYPTSNFTFFFFESFI